MIRSLLSVSVFLTIGSGAFAANEKVIKECSTVLKNLDSGKSMEVFIQIVIKGDVAFSRVTETLDGKTKSYLDTVDILEDTVRGNLTVKTDPTKLNVAERLVIHAMALEQDPIFEGEYKTGIDLRKVRSATVYIVGDPTNMGTASIIETRDSESRVLGSFLGGFLIGACR